MPRRGARVQGPAACWAVVAQSSAGIKAFTYADQCEDCVVCLCPPVLHLKLDPCHSLVFASWARTRGALHGVLAELQYRCPEIRGNQIKFHWLWPLFFTINHRPPVVSPQFSAFDYGHSGALLLHSAATPSTAGHNPVIERIRSATVC